MGNAESTSFPYTIQEQNKSYLSPFGWTLHNGIENGSNKRVSIFSFDKTKYDSKSDCARNNMVLLRQLRHPFILKYINGIEQGNIIYVVTERVTPLILPYAPADSHSTPSSPVQSTKLTSSLASSNVNTHNYSSTNTDSQANDTQKNVFTHSSLDLSLKPLPSTSPEAVQLLLSAGLYQLYVALTFLNNTASIIHGNINPSSIFIAENGDWKLGGLDLAFKVSQITNTGTTTLKNTSANDLAAELGIAPQSLSSPASQSTLIGAIPLTYKNHYSSQIKTFVPPEISKNEWRRIETYPIHAIDAYAVGQLLKLLFSTQNVPPLFQPDYKKYFPTSPISSPQSSQLYEYTPSSLLPQHSTILLSPYFNNHLISALNFLDLIHIKTTEEKTAFFTQFATIYTMFPILTLSKRIIPQLIASFDVITPKTAAASFGGILNATFAVSKVSLPPEEYNQYIVPLITKLFQSPEIDVRISLLQNIHQYCQFLSIDMVFHDILPLILMGIHDNNVVIRELTIKSLVSFYPHFVKVREGNYDHLYNNLSIISNKLYNDTYTYASSTLSVVANYIGYTQYMASANAANAKTTETITNNNENISSTVGTAGGNVTSMSGGSAVTASQQLTPQQIQQQQQQQQQQQLQQQLYKFKTLPSLYLSTIIFPILLQHYPQESSHPSVRIAIIQSLTLLSPLLSITQQETLSLTIFAKGVKDYHHNVRVTALDGLLIALLTFGFTISTICNKIIPFISVFICDKDKDVYSRALYIIQFCLYKITHQYYNINATNTTGGGSSNLLSYSEIISQYNTTFNNVHGTSSGDQQSPYYINTQQLINTMANAMKAFPPVTTGSKDDPLLSQLNPNTPVSSTSSLQLTLSKPIVINSQYSTNSSPQGQIPAAVNDFDYSGIMDVPMKNHSISCNSSGSDISLNKVPSLEQQSASESFGDWAGTKALVQPIQQSTYNTIKQQQSQPQQRIKKPNHAPINSPRSSDEFELDDSFNNNQQKKLQPQQQKEQQKQPHNNDNTNSNNTLFDDMFRGLSATANTTHNNNASPGVDEWSSLF